MVLIEQLKLFEILGRSEQGKPNGRIGMRQHAEHKRQSIGPTSSRRNSLKVAATSLSSKTWGNDRIRLWSGYCIGLSAAGPRTIPC